MKKIFIILIALLFSIPASAQLKKRIQQFDDFMGRRYYKVNYDTTYMIRPPHSRWTIKLSSILAWSEYKITGRHTETETTFKSTLKSDINPTFSISVGYYGFGASFSMSFNNDKGKKSNDFELRFNSYGNAFGFDVTLNQIHSLSCDFLMKYDGTTYKLIFPENFVTQTNLSAYCYYAFNKKRFSYPAAFTQGYIQKRSAGSLLVGAAVNVNITDVGNIEEHPEDSTSVLYIVNSKMGLGLGYGYNLVLPHNWLIHASAIPYVIFRGYCSYLIYDDQDGNEQAHFPEVFLVSRFAVVHSFGKSGRWFFGLTAQNNFSEIESNDLTTRHGLWEFIGFVGVRL